MKLDDIKAAIGVKPYFEDSDIGVIYNCDCLEILPKIPEGSADLVLTDPPYGLDKRLSSGGGAHRFAKFRLGYVGQDWDEKISDAHFEGIFRASMHQIIWGANYYCLPATRGIIVWDKRNMLPTFSRCEYAWTSFDCPAKLYEVPHDDDRCHPTQKPVELMRKCLKDFSNDNSLVLDPFLGSGTTAVATKQLGRKFIGVEVNEVYCKISVERLRQSVLSLSDCQDASGKDSKPQEDSQVDLPLLEIHKSGRG